MMKRNSRHSKPIRILNQTIAPAVARLRPPEKITVSEWADKYRRLSPENSAEAGAWRTSRTPYLKEIMNAFTDPKIRNIAVVAPSQVGKTELELNMLGYAIDVDPGPMLFILPTVEVAQDMSKRRIAPMIRDNNRLRDKVAEIKARDKNNTILRKTFPGGMLTMAGSNSPAALASIPARYVFGDERDRWAESAGSEGDPWTLAEARTTTFYNAKLVEVSSPTIKGYSAIEKSYNLGTRERWCHQCPECGAWNNIVFRNIKMDYETVKVKGKKDYIVKSVLWACPDCACVSTEEVMRKQPAKWIAENPNAYDHGFRSFWINAFSSPWRKWESIAFSFLQSQYDPEKLKGIYNTTFGELWEDRGDNDDEETMMARREEYQGELPSGVLVLTCGVDTQDDRLEYEVVGHGMYGETWGIKQGVIMGRPDTPEVWQQLDDVLDKTYHYSDGKRGLNISMTCIDSGGHYSHEVYNECRNRQARRVFAIRGMGGSGKQFAPPAKQTKIIIKGQYVGLCWVYNIGVDAGKAKIMSSLKVQEPGPKYCHFPKGEERGYNVAFFNGLLSEKMVLKRAGGRERWAWDKLPGHNRNEALDCRNYALAAFQILDPDMDAVERRSKGEPKRTATQAQRKPKRRKKDNLDKYFDDW
jgi:phage terminase large subunit GpA-like protein